MQRVSGVSNGFFIYPASLHRSLMKEKTAHGNATIPELILFVRLYGHFSLGCVKD